MSGLTEGLAVIAAFASAVAAVGSWVAATQSNRLSQSVQLAFRQAARYDMFVALETCLNWAIRCLNGIASHEDEPRVRWLDVDALGRAGLPGTVVTKYIDTRDWIEKNRYLGKTCLQKTNPRHTLALEELRERKEMIEKLLQQLG